MNFDNPTPTQVKIIEAAQQRELAGLNTKTHWTAEDFESVLHCYNQYSGNEWVVSLESIRELAFDARTPDEKAKLLQGLLKQFSKAKKCPL